MSKVYWRNKDWKDIDIDKISDINYLRNIIKFLLKKDSQIENCWISDYDWWEFYK